MICAVCKGSGNLLTALRGVQYWCCPDCGGYVVHVLHGPPTTHAGRARKAQKD